MKLFVFFFLTGSVLVLNYGAAIAFWTLSIVLLCTISVLAFLWMMLFGGFQAIRHAALRVVIPGLVLGACWSGFSLQRQLDSQLPVSLDGVEVIVLGSVIGQGGSEPHRLVFDFRPEKIWVPEDSSAVIPQDIPRGEQVAITQAHAIRTETTDQLIGRRFRVSWYGSTSPVVSGQRWMLQLRLRRPHSLSNPGGFDYTKQLLTARVHALASVKKSTSNELVSQNLRAFSDYRVALDDALAQQAVPLSQLALMRGLLIGLRDKIEDETWRLLRATGTSHLLAISGLHIGLVAAWGVVLGGGLWRIVVCSVRSHSPVGRFNQLDSAAVVALSAAFVYAALAGFTLPTQRALVMLAAFLIYRRLRINANSLDVLAVAAFAVVCLDPLAPLAAGFWLSFCAVLTILLLANRQQFHPTSISDRSLIQLFSNCLIRCKFALQTHLILSLSLIPLTVMFFSEVSLVSPVANLLAIPIVGLITVPALLLWAALHAIVDVHWLLLVANASLEALMWLLIQFDTRLPASIFTPALSRWHILLLIVAIVVIALPNQAVSNKYLLPLVFPALLATFSPRPVAALRITVLDVGQGLSVVVRTASSILVYDTGGLLSQNSTMAERVVIPYLRSQGISELDMLMLSHADTDHAVGAQDLLDELSVNRVLGSFSEYPVMSACDAGMRWIWDEVEFVVLHPAETDGGDRNDRSCSVLIRLGESTVLLPGDIEQKGESTLIDRLVTDAEFSTIWSATDQLSLLVAPHHGSGTSSTAPFLDVFRPKVVVYSIGHKNRFGFPHESVQMRYKLLGTQQLRTDVSGAITVDFDSSGQMIGLWRNRCVVTRPWLSRCDDVELTWGLGS